MYFDAIKGDIQALAELFHAFEVYQGKSTALRHESVKTELGPLYVDFTTIYV